MGEAEQLSFTTNGHTSRGFRGLSGLLVVTCAPFALVLFAFQSAQWLRTAAQPFPSSSPGFLRAPANTGG